jgi:tetratricopeptide (TPR) repeat protein
MLQFEMALSCYEKAALERPLYAEAYCNMGVIYKNRGDLEAAIACYERYLFFCITSSTLVFWVIYTNNMVKTWNAPAMILL